MIYLRFANSTLMKEFKYYKNYIRLWFFKTILFFSVLTFTGFNVEIQSAFHQSVKTELVDSRICKPVYSLKSNKYKEINTLFVNPVSPIKSFNIWAILNFNLLSEIEFKSYLKRSLQFNFYSKRVLPNILYSSSKDENPYLSLS